VIGNDLEEEIISIRSSNSKSDSLVASCIEVRWNVEEIEDGRW